MRKIFWAAPALLFAILMVLALGCTEKTGSGGSGDNQVGQIRILVTDTLKYVPGDSASTPVTIIVTSRTGTVLPGRTVSYGLENSALGFLERVNPSQGDTTDDLGRLQLLYTSIAEPGINRIFAVSEGVSAIDSIVIQEETTVIQSLVLTLNPRVLQVPPQQDDSVRVCARITDIHGVGLPNVSLRFSVSGGALRAAPVTDASGQTCTYWFSNSQYGSFTITASIANLSATDTVRVLPIPGYGTLTVRADMPRIWANNCATPDTIRAVLKDARNIAVVGDTVLFAGYGGTVEGRGITDSQGRAKVAFCDVGQHSDPDSAFVIAMYPKWGLFDTVRIWIEPALSISQFNLWVNNSVGIAGVDSTPINVNVLYEDGTSVEGMEIRLQTNCGNFTYAVDTLSNGRFRLPNFYRFCNQITEPGIFDVEVWASIRNSGITVARSDTIHLTVNPGNPRQVRVYRARTPILLNDSTQTWAIVYDSLGNHVRSGRPVTFSTTLGTINPAAPQVAQTDASGTAWAILYSGTSAGQAIVKASLGVGLQEDSVVVGVQSQDAASIRLSVSNASPQVQGTGGQSYTQLYADVTDAMGNPVPDGRVVVFSIPFGLPNGVNINNRGLTDSATTAGGRAIATLNAGPEPGPVMWRATTRVQRPDSTWQTIQGEHSGVTIVAGPPHAITIFPTQTGVHAGGSAWELEISALVTDIYGNPVRCNTAVFFEVEGPAGADTAQIVSDSVFTCNLNRDGDSYLGVAYTRLRYLSPATFETVYITARTGGQPVAEESIPFVLPLQEPEVSLIFNPGNWVFALHGANASVECRSILTDGNDIRINGATIWYTTQRGVLRPAPHPQTPAIRAWATTGPNGDPGGADGQTSLWLRGVQADFFVDDVSIEYPTEVTIQVEGFPGATDAGLINFRRVLGN